MKQLIQDFTQHLKKALEINESTSLSAANKPISNVLICGLGGSGIGATIISQIVSDDANCPIVVNKDYFIPNFVGENTLVIACSYSGNTEETLEMLTQAEQKNATIACITSGGKLAAISIEKNYNHILIPGGHPPRAAFGFAFPGLFQLLHHYKVITSNYANDFNKAIDLINNNEATLVVEANAITEKLYKKIPVIYTSAPYEGVAVRFRQQINENSKTLCWHHVIPEMNHNELVGWTNKNEDLAVVIFRNEDDYYRNKKRIDVNKTVFQQYTSTIIEVHSKGQTMLQRALYLIHLGDWVSYLLGTKNGVDIVEVDVITHLKNELAKL